MGLIITRRKDLNNAADFFKLKLAISNPAVRRLTGTLLQTNPDGRLKVESVLDSYAGDGPQSELGRLRAWAFSHVLDLTRRGLGVPLERLQTAVQNPSIRRTIVNSLKTLDLYGVRFPQRFYAPLMIVWNLTYACNLRCRHCYENAGPLRPAELGMPELTVDEKLAVIDEIADSYIPTLSFSGGEPLLAKGFWEVARRARERGLYISMNSNGTMITRDVARRLKELDFSYIGASVDSPSPEVHDAFRGVPGAYEKTLAGIRNMVEAEVPVILAFTITRHNYKDLPAMFKLGDDLGVTKVMIYNFIPTGRATSIVEADMTPRMREEALRLMYDYSVQGGQLCTTAPQFGRVCKEMDRTDLVPLAHGNPGIKRDLPILADLIGGCGVGRAYAAIQPDGRITPCVYMPDITIGSIPEDTILDVWHHSPLLESLADHNDLKGACGSCENKAVCGGCRARAYSYFGDFKAPDPGCLRNEAYWNQIGTGESEFTEEPLESLGVTLTAG